jgi:Zn-finger in ubiquitin-hydrolases and other protein
VQACTHQGQITEVEPQTPTGCTDCLALGDSCDSSPNQHATAHFAEYGHPLIQSFERGEDWIWCYVDEVLVEPA